MAETKYIRDFSYKILTALHSGGTGSRTLGVAGGNVGVKFVTQFKPVKQRGSKLYCLQVKKIDATFYANPVVQIAKNFKRGTCEYHKVLTHENQHVETLKKAHKEYMPFFKKHLRVTSKKLSKLPPVSIQGMAEQQQQIVSEINAHLSEFMNTIGEDAAKRQARLDTAREYQKVWSRCRNWEKHLQED